MLTAGRPAPEFSLVNQNDEKQDLAALRGHPVLVYFYPRADTPGCTQQACGLRDIAGQVGDTVILGISPDKPAALAKFRDKYALNFDLLSDVDHFVAEAYGVKAFRVIDPSRLGVVLKEALACQGPTLVDIVCQPLHEANAPVSEWVA